MITKTANKIKENNTALPPVEDLVKQEINALREFPLTELQERLVNYLLANVDDIIETLEIV